MGSSALETISAVVGRQRAQHHILLLVLFPMYSVTSYRMCHGPCVTVSHPMPSLSQGSPWAKGRSQGSCLGPVLLTAQMKCAVSFPSILRVFSSWNDDPAGPLVIDEPSQMFAGLFAQSGAPNLRHLARTFPNSEPLLLSLRSLTVSFFFRVVFFLLSCHQLSRSPNVGVGDSLFAYLSRSPFLSSPKCNCKEP